MLCSPDNRVKNKQPTLDNNYLENVSDIWIEMEAGR